MNMDNYHLRPDRQLLLDLLEEYAGKLRQVCDSYYDRQSIWAPKLSWGLPAFASYSTLAFLSLMIPIAFSGNNHDLLYGILSKEVLSKGAFLFFAILTVIMYIKIHHEIKTYQEIDRSKFIIHPLFFSLEELVSKASQVEDHALANSDENILFRLRLAEAESALEYADWTLNSVRFFPFPWSRTSKSPSTRHYRSRSASL